MDQYKWTKKQTEPELVLEKNTYKSIKYQASLAKMKEYPRLFGFLLW